MGASPRRTQRDITCGRLCLPLAPRNDILLAVKEAVMKWPPRLLERRVSLNIVSKRASSALGGRLGERRY
jgi:hypothetical protein